jgi:hypothetical protein
LEATGGENKPNKKERKADKKNKAAAMAVDEVLPTEPETNVPRTSPERMDPDTSTGNMVALKDHVAELFTGTVHVVVCWAVLPYSCTLSEAINDWITHLRDMRSAEYSWHTYAADNL